jgi:hypothetical protein
MEELKQTLKDMMEAISTGDSIVYYLERIDEIKQNLDDNTHSMLRHYLENHSYTKALDFLENKDNAQEGI